MVRDPVTVSLVIFRGEVSKDGMLKLFGFDEEMVIDSVTVIVDLRVAEILLSTDEEFTFAVESEVGNFVALRRVVIVAFEGSTVLSDSMTVGVVTMFELLLMIG